MSTEAPGLAQRLREHWRAIDSTDPKALHLAHDCLAAALVLEQLGITQQQVVDALMCCKGWRLVRNERYPWGVWVHNRNRALRVKPRDAAAYLARCGALPPPTTEAEHVP